jgi:predicted dehydrogenase
METKIRWGILGTGLIANKFACAIQGLPDAHLLAVGSRAAGTVDKFAQTFRIPNRHPSYEKLANDPEVDVVYVATPHPFHMENTILCLNAGKAVLCEKPFEINAVRAKRMIDAARDKKLFLMEAMWTRFLPIIAQVRDWLSREAIGRVRILQADFGFTGDWTPEHRLLNPQLAGGALLDVGVYTVSLASMVFGRPPEKIASLAHIGKTGVDEQAAMTFRYDDGQLAVLSCAVKTQTPQQAVIAGTKGTITIHSPFWSATTATISIKGKKDQTVKIPHRCNGFEYEAQEVMQCLRAGKLESDCLPLDETLEIVKTMDQIREQWPLKYPMD